jgi:hypothetical protein
LMPAGVADGLALSNDGYPYEMKVV